MAYPLMTLLPALAVMFAAATILGKLLHRQGFPLEATDTRLGCVDGLRGYLALAVVAHHCIIWLQIVRLGGSWTAPSINAFNQLGSASVGLFFMVTGFVFYPKIRTGFSQTNWPAVLISRIFRILPLLAVSIALVTLLIAMRTDRGLDSAYPAQALIWLTSWGQPPLLGYADAGRINAYVLWSLWHEWMFYLVILPVCAAITDILRGRVGSWVTPLGLLAMGILLRRVEGAPSFLTYLPLFAMGMLAHECRERPNIRLLFASPIVSVIALASLIIGFIGWSSPNPIPALGFFGFFFGSVACGNSFFGLLRTSGALVLGEISFGIYLLHGLLLSLLFVDWPTALNDLSTPSSFFIVPIVVVLPIILVAAAGHLMVERPTIQYGKSLLKRHFPKNKVIAAQFETAP